MIIRQSTDAGTKVAEGTSVSYVVSKGPKPADQVKVPTLTGKTLGDAISALNARNLTYTEVDIDSAEPSGKVVKVDPGEGTSVDVGTAITGRFTSPPITLASAPSIPATATTQLASWMVSNLEKSLCIPLTPTS